MEPNIPFEAVIGDAFGTFKFQVITTSAVLLEISPLSVTAATTSSFTSSTGISISTSSTSSTTINTSTSLNKQQIR